MRLVPALILAALLCLSLTACFPFAVYNKHPGVSGTVTDAVTGQPLAGVQVIYLSREGVETVTDERGYYQVPGENQTLFNLPPSIEAPPSSAAVQAVKAGYFPFRRFGYNSHGGAFRDNEWTFDLQLLSHDHPVAPYALALHKALDEGRGYEDWLTVLKNMRRDGFSRREAAFMWKHALTLFYTETTGREFWEEWHRLRAVVYKGGEVWPLSDPPVQE